MKAITISTIVALVLSSSGYATDIGSGNPSDIYSLPVSEPTKKFKISQHKMKASGHIKLWYQTMDHGGVTGGDAGLFKRQTTAKNEWFSASAHLQLTGDVNDNFSYGAAVQGASSMGLNSYIAAAEAVRPVSTGDAGSEKIPFWFSEMYGIYTTGNTKIKLGRMELNTPMAYTEKWNAVTNTFEALTVTNTDLPDTKVMGMWISKGNGATTKFDEAPQVFGSEETFNGYMQYDDNSSNNISSAGMLVAGVKNNSIANIPLQAWYYLAPDSIQAFWLQADVKGKDLGFAQKASMSFIGAGNGTTGALQSAIAGGTTFANTQTKTKDTYAVATKLTAKIEGITLYGAASKTSSGNLPIANTATNYKKTRLPTACVFNDGMVAAQPSTTSFKVGASTKFGKSSGLSIAYGNYAVGQNTGYMQPNAKSGGPASAGFLANSRGEDLDMNEFDLILSTKYKDIKMKAIYVYLDKTYVPGSGNGSSVGDAASTYGTDDNHIIRFITSLAF